MNKIILICLFLVNFLYPDDILICDVKSGIPGDDTSNCIYYKNVDIKIFLRTDTMTFGRAFELLVQGKKITKKIWKSSEYIQIVSIPNYEPCIVYYDSLKMYPGWMPSFNDIISNNWLILIK